MGKWFAFPSLSAHFDRIQQSGNAFSQPDAQSIKFLGPVSDAKSHNQAGSASSDRSHFGGILGQP
jgi:hypothetical protein